MTTHDTVINLPLTGGEVRLEWTEVPAVDRTADTVARILSPTELGIVTENALIDHEVDLVSPSEPAETITEVTEKIHTMRFEECLRSFEPGLARLEAAFQEGSGPSAVSVSRRSAASLEETGALPVVTEEPLDIAEEEGLFFFAQEAPARIKAEKAILEEIKEKPTQLDAHEATLAMAAVQENLEQAIALQDVSAQIALLGATRWILENTQISELVITNTPQPQLV